MRHMTDRFRYIMMTLAALAVLAVLVVVLINELFVVRNVVVQGVEDEDQDAIIRTAGIRFGSSVFQVDTQKIQQNLEASGTYAVESVRVQKPDTVVLELRVRTRDAVTLNGGKYLIMDSEGYVVESVDVLSDEDLIYIYGLNATTYRVGGKITAPEDRLNAMCLILSAVSSQGASDLVSEINVTDIADLTLTTRTGIRVELGDTSQMENKILWMKAAVTDLETRGETRGTLDVSSADKADYQPG